MGQGGNMAIKNLLVKKVKVSDFELRLWVFLAFLIFAAFLIFCLISEVAYAVNHGKIPALVTASVSSLIAWLVIYLIFLSNHGLATYSFPSKK